MVNPLIRMKIKSEERPTLIAIAAFQFNAHGVQIPIALVHFGHTVGFVMSDGSLHKHRNQFIGRVAFQTGLVRIVAPPTRNLTLGLQRPGMKRGRLRWS